MEFSSTKHENKLVVKVGGRLDAITASDFDTESQQWLSESAEAVIADLSGLEYISSAGLRSILTAAKQLKANKSNLVFCGLSGMVDEVFAVSGFAAMFTIYKTIDEALAA